MLPVLAHKGPIIPFIAELERCLLALRAERPNAWPDLTKHCRTVTIFSDYGGESHEATHTTYTFLCIPYETLGVFFKEAQAIRERHGLGQPYKELALKDLDYGPLARSIKEWLRLIACFPGLLFTLHIDRRLRSIIRLNERATLVEMSKLLHEGNYGKRSGEASEKLVRIVHTVAYLAAALSVDGQQLFWMSDQDAIVANDKAFDGLRNLFGHVLTGYAPGRFKRVFVAKSFKEIDPAANYDDLVGLADLVAGSIERLFFHRSGKEPRGVKEGVNEVLNWLCDYSTPLKKIIFSIQPHADGGVEAGLTWFALPQRHVTGAV